MSNMNWARGTPPRVEHKFLSFLVEIEDSVKISVREEQSSSKLRMKLLHMFPHLSQKSFSQRLSAEFLNQPLIINLSSHFPWCNYHFLFALHDI